MNGRLDDDDGCMVASGVEDRIVYHRLGEFPRREWPQYPALRVEHREDADHHERLGGG